MCPYLSAPLVYTPSPDTHCLTPLHTTTTHKNLPHTTTLPHHHHHHTPPRALCNPASSHFAINCQYLSLHNDLRRDCSRNLHLNEQGLISKVWRSSSPLINKENLSHHQVRRVNILRSKSNHLWTHLPLHYWIWSEMVSFFYHIRTTWCAIKCK